MEMGVGERVRPQINTHSVYELLYQGCVQTPAGRITERVLTLGAGS